MNEILRDYSPREIWFLSLRLWIVALGSSPVVFICHLYSERDLFWSFWRRLWVAFAFISFAPRFCGWLVNLFWFWRGLRRPPRRRHRRAQRQATSAGGVRRGRGERVIR